MVNVSGATDGVTVAYPAGEGPFGLGFADHIGYQPGDVPINPGKYSDLDAYALKEKFRHRCTKCDFGFLSNLLLPPSGVECVEASVWLSSNCGGTKCTTTDRTRPGYKKLCSPCFPYMVDPEEQTYDLVKVYIPIRVHKYLQEYVMIKSGRPDFGMCPTTCSTIREISYTEPKLKTAFSEEQVVIYETALLAWYPTLLQSESLQNEHVATLSDPIEKVTNFLCVRDIARFGRDFFCGKVITTGATTWTPSGAMKSQIQESTEFLCPSGLRPAKDKFLTIPEPPKNSPQTRTIPKPPPTAPNSPSDNTSAAGVSLDSSPSDTPSGIKIPPAAVSCDAEGKVDQNALQQEAIKREKIIREANKLCAQYERAQTKEIASIPPQACGNPTSFADKQVSVLKGEPTKDENRSGTVKMYSRREMLMKKIVDDVDRLKKADKDVPEEFQKAYDEFYDPERIPDYILWQRDEQFAEKINHAEDKDVKSAVMVGPQCSMANVGQTKLGIVVDSANARVMKDNSRCVTAPQHELDRAAKLTLNHLKANMPEKKIQELWIASGGFEGDTYVPGTWTRSKYENEKQSWRQRDPLRAMNLFVKFDVMAEGKTQRLVSDENGMRQVARNFTGKIAEELEGSVMHEHNTKHKTKQDVHNLLFRNTQKKWPTGKPGVIVEGDGSAWDSSCGKAVRWYIEQVFETYVFEALGPLIHGMGPEMIKHAMARVSEEMNMQWNYKDHSGLYKGMMMVNCDFVMRSTGDSLTSFLNRLVNLIMWTLSLTKDVHIPKSFRQPVVRYHCRWTPLKRGAHKERHMFFIFEGDDSILKLEREILRFREQIENYWRSWGFNMVLKFIVSSDPTTKLHEGSVHDMAEFCGYKYFIRDGTFHKACGPDVARRLTNSLSTSVQANQTVNGRNAVAAASAAAQAEAFASSSPGLSAMFQARSDLYEKKVWKKVNFEIKTKHALARKARGAVDDTSWRGQYQQAINSSWYYTHHHEARLLERASGATDAQRYMWDGATATDHTTHPWEAASLGLKPGYIHM